MHHIQDVEKEYLAYWLRLWQYLSQQINRWEVIQRKQFIFRKIDAHNEKLDVLDQWIMSRVHSVIALVHELAKDFSINKHIHALLKLLNDFFHQYAPIKMQQLKDQVENS